MHRETVPGSALGKAAVGVSYSPAHGDTAFTVPTFEELLRRAARCYA